MLMDFLDRREEFPNYCRQNNEPKTQTLLKKLMPSPGYGEASGN